MKTLLLEPALISAVIQTGLALLVAFGTRLTAEQVAAVMAFSAAVLAVAVRSLVTPVHK